MTSGAAGSLSHAGALLLRLVSTLMLVALLVSGCAAWTSSGTARLPDGVTVEVRQQRADVAPRQAQVVIGNGSDQTLVIGRVRMRDPRFAEDAARVVERESRVAPGATVDVRVQLAAVVCDGPDDAEPQVTFAFAVDGAEGEATVAAADPLGFLAPLHERECRAERVTDAASVAFTAFEPSPPGAPARLELTIAPTGRGEVAIDAVQETNLISFGAASVDGAFPLGVAVATGDTAPIVVSLPIVPLRCDPHAVQEDKRGTIFDVRVVVGGAAGEIERFVGEDLRGRILSWVADWCGFGE
ncbi:hypothetical protein AB1K54_13875 [Microbacterium sp. BWT-B31]|uniref:hypothetical protein n=1 Tax=Microbacterium sp. BWT-B31 TaxID=3232072 RepID=UPI0035291C4E